jgi:dephospho-CoA kinase
MIVVGLTGYRLCGKNLFAYYLRKNYRFRILDFTKDVLMPILKKEGKEPTRENLVKTAMKLREKYGTDFLARELCKTIKDLDRKYVITGIRFPEEVIYIKKQYGEDLVLVGVKCKPKIRYERSKRSRVKEDRNMIYDQFVKKDRLPTESIINESMKLTNFIVTNERTKEEFYHKIDKLMEKII